MPKYRIHQAAQAVGISAQLLRAWERRYGLLSPVRTESGYRLYSEEEITFLRAVKALVDQGHSISDVARTPRERLLETAPPQKSPTAPQSLSSKGTFLDATLVAIQNFDRPALESALFRATGMGALTPAETCDRVLTPLLVEIGIRWEQGRLSVAAEHFGSSILRHHLQALLAQASQRSAQCAPIVCASLEGELHEGGILVFAIHVATLGWPILYLGAHTPLTDIIATAEQEQAQGIALSMTMLLPKAFRASFLAPLVTWKNKNPSRFVLIGGKGARLMAKERYPTGLIFEDRIDLIPRVLSKISREKPNDR
jgi:DNA-binding transcriptional MerR regulator